MEVLLCSNSLACIVQNFRSAVYHFFFKKVEKSPLLCFDSEKYLCGGKKICVRFCLFLFSFDFYGYTKPP